MKKVLVLGLFCGFSLNAEIPFEQLKGLSALMKPIGSPSHARAEANQPQEEETVNGFLALKTGTLERIRFFEPYKIYKQYTHDGIHLIPVEQREPVDPSFPIHPEWQHPAFKIKTLSPSRSSSPDSSREGSRAGSPAGDIIDDPHAFTKQFEYPLSPISALIQWLFPSVDGALFVANDRSKDPIGEVGLNLRNISQLPEIRHRIDTLIHEKIGLEREIYILESSEEIKVCNAIINDLDSKIKELGQKIQSTQDRDQKEQFIEDKKNASTQKKQKTDEKDRFLANITPKNQRISALSREIADLRHTAKPLEFIPRILRCIQETPSVPSPETFRHCLQQSDERLETSVEAQKQIFVEILYNALLQDGTFGRDHDPIYPKHIALHALLGYLWRVLDSKEQLIDVMREANLLRSPTVHAHRLSQPILERDTRLSYTKTEYEEFKQKFIKKEALTFEQLAYLGYGYENYEQLYPESLSYASAKAPNRHGVEGRTYPDCGETALRNFFNAITFKGGGEFETHLLDTLGHSNNKIAEIQAFYERFPNISSQQSQVARDTWSEIVSDLNDKENSLNSADPMDVRYDGYSNIKASLGMRNILNVMAKLTGDEKLKEPWDREEEEIQIAQKLSRLCTIFSRGEEFQLDWEINEGNDRAPNHGNFKFTITKKDREPLNFTFSISDTHFLINFSTMNQRDWRKNSPNIKNNLLQPFYGKNPSHFLAPSLTATELMAIVNTPWASLTKPSNVLLTLRFLYKKLASQVEDHDAQSSIVHALSLIQNSKRGEQESPWILDFVQTFLIEKLQEKNPRRDKNFVLKMATSDNATSIVEFLLNKQPNMPNAEKTRALQSAVLGNNLAIVTLLVQSGADINSAYDVGYAIKGKTPLSVAQERGYSEIVTFLENAKNKQRETLVQGSLATNARN